MTLLRRSASVSIVASLLTTLVVGCGGADEPVAQEGNFKDQKLLGPDPSGEPTFYPIILAHGFNASPGNLGFYEVADALRADGHVVYEAEVPPYNSVEVRSSHLATFVDQALEDGAERVNIIAHSMGGLDSRYLASEDGLAYGEVIASITTISTPHWGSASADHLLDILDGLAVPDEDIDKLVSGFGSTFSAVAEDSHFRDALRAISEEQTPVFNDATRDHPSVYYQSFAGVSSVGGIKNPRDPVECGVILGNYKTADLMDPLLVASAAHVSHGTFDPNDGLVTVESAQWGEFRGCIPADHADEVGQLKDSKPDARTGFEHRRFYRNLAFELSRWGF